MSADFFIHVLKNITQKEFELFHADTLDSKYYNPTISPRGIAYHDLAMKIYNTPKIFVSEVSWMKAGLFGDSNSYVPKPAEIIAELIGEETVITNKLIKEVKKAFTYPNQTTHYKSADGKPVIDFFKKHYGWKIFTVSW